MGGENGQGVDNDGDDVVVVLPRPHIVEIVVVVVNKRGGWSERAR